MNIKEQLIELGFESMAEEIETAHKSEAPLYLKDVTKAYNETSEEEFNKAEYENVFAIVLKYFKSKGG